MSDKRYTCLFDEFYYAAPLQGGLQIASMSASLPDTLRVALREFMCTVDFNGDEREERILFCPPLRGFVKLFISRDVQRERNFFYHGISVNAAALRKQLPADENLFVNGVCALSATASRADSRNMPAVLPVRESSQVAVTANSLVGPANNDPTVLARWLYLAFVPFLNGGRAVRFGFAQNEKELAAMTAIFVLSALPQALYPFVSMRFSADAGSFGTTYKNKYCFFLGAQNTDCDFSSPRALTEREDTLGIFTALGAYIAARGMSAYRVHILPVLQAWVLACRAQQAFSQELLYALLKSVPGIHLPERAIDAHCVEQYLSKGDADWFAAAAALWPRAFAPKRMHSRLEKHWKRMHCSTAPPTGSARTARMPFSNRMPRSAVLRMQPPNSRYLHRCMRAFGKTKMRSRCCLQ